jgi:hypothetical protein
MIPPDAYQLRASECLALAEQSSDADDRMTWRELALCWLRLSDHAEQFRYRVRDPIAGAHRLARSVVSGGMSR